MSILQWLKFALLLILVYFSGLRQKKRSFDERWFTLRGWCLAFFKFMKIETSIIQNGEIPQETVYYVSNHQGQFDPLLLMSAFTRPMTFISKVENLKIPVIGTWGKLIGFITFKREAFEDNVTMLRQSARTLKEGRSILIFPEGTRSKSNAMLPFKAGALLPAYLAKVSIVPVTQIHTHEMDKRGQLKHTLQIIIDRPIPYVSYKDTPYAQMAIIIHDQIESNIKNALT